MTRADEPREDGEVEETIAAAIDQDFYRAQAPDLDEVDPVKHYVAQGHAAGLKPAPDFDTAFYLSRSPDVRDAGMNGFFHYLRWGRIEGRAPSPEAIAQAEEPTSAPERLLRSAVDPDFYARSYPEIARTYVVPYKHYLHFGWHAGLDPSAEFSTRFYRSRPYDTDAHENPLHHYLRIGWARGRLPRPLLDGDHARGPAVEAALRPYFDPDFYRAAYPELGPVDPLLDYIEKGWSAGRDPAPWFSTADYVHRFPDVTAIGVNPFLHHLLWGRSQGFPPARGAAALAVVRPGAPVSSAELAPLTLPTAGPQPSAPVDPSRLDLHWVIPDIEGPGRGGHMTIFRIVRWLEAFGHRCTVWVNDPHPDWSDDARSELVARSYQAIAAEIRVLPEAPLFPADAVVIATSWTTALVVNAIASARNRFYFVQDDERMFHAAGAKSIAADRTYRLDMGYLCAGPWLADRLATEHGRWTRSFELAPDQGQHPPVTPPDNPVSRIAVYARAHTDRRAVDLALLGLAALARTGTTFEAHLFGSDADLETAPFPAVSHGVLDPESLADLYRSCDLGLCFSATNHSLIPQEMMACGLPVIELDGPSTRAVFPPEAATLAGPEPDGIAEALRRLLTDAAERRAQVARALAWVSTRSWEASARAVESAILERLADTGVELRSPPPAVVLEPAPVASIIVPTLNGGPLFRRVLERVLEQRTAWPFEVVVADSQSDDGTWELVRDHPQVRALSIPRTEFQHGGTRNRAAAEARSEHLVFITQDAEPADRLWLGDLVGALQRHPRAAGAFGRHLPRPEASPFTRRNLHGFFRHLGDQPLERSKFWDLQRWREDRAFRRELHFLSNNNSCLRRSVWVRLPFPAVDYGEDQAWADRVLGERYSLVYAPTARVIHSHEYDPGSRFERARVEGRWLRSWFGYDLIASDPAAHIARMNAGDEAWGVRNGVPAEIIEAKKQLNAAEIEGLMAGQREADA
jgi:glycosyltransferase involved in cell wall biosynthesis